MISPNVLRPDMTKLNSMDDARISGVETSMGALDPERNTAASQFTMGSDRVGQTSNGHQSRNDSVKVPGHFSATSDDSPILGEAMIPQMTV